MRVFTHKRRSLWGLLRFSPGHTLGAEGRARGHPQECRLHEDTVLSLPMQQTHLSGKVTHYGVALYSNELRWGARLGCCHPSLHLGSPTLNSVCGIPRSPCPLSASLALIRNTPPSTREAGPYGARAACRWSQRFSLPASLGCKRHTCTCPHPPGWH